MNLSWQFFVHNFCFYFFHGNFWHGNLGKLPCEHYQRCCQNIATHFFRNQSVVKLAIVKNNIMSNRKIVPSTQMAIFFGIFHFLHYQNTSFLILSSFIMSFFWSFYSEKFYQEHEHGNYCSKWWVLICLMKWEYKDVHLLTWQELCYHSKDGGQCDHYV